MAPRIYPSLPVSTPPLYCEYVKCIRLPESTPPSQNIPPFPTTICDPPRIYPSIPEYTPLLKQLICATYTPPSQNIPTFSTTLDSVITHNLPRSRFKIIPGQILYATLYATLPESTPPSKNIPPFFNNYI